MMPSVYRFRIINSEGRDIGDVGLDILDDYTRGECREPVGEYFMESCNSNMKSNSDHAQIH